VENTRYARVFRSRQQSNYNILAHDLSTASGCHGTHLYQLWRWQLKVAFLLVRGRTHRHTKSQTQLIIITLPMPRLLTACVV